MDKFTPDIKQKLDSNLFNQVIMAVFSLLTFKTIHRISFLNLEDRHKELNQTH